MTSPQIPNLVWERCAELRTQNDALKAETARLREALGDIVNDSDVVHLRAYDLLAGVESCAKSCPTCALMAKARAALEPKP
jgi:ferredoxin